MESSKFYLPSKDKTFEINREPRVPLLVTLQVTVILQTLSFSDRRESLRSTVIYSSRTLRKGTLVVVLSTETTHVVDNSLIKKQKPLVCRSPLSPYESLLSPRSLVSISPFWLLFPTDVRSLFTTLQVSFSEVSRSHSVFLGPVQGSGNLYCLVFTSRLTLSLPVAPGYWSFI